MCLCVELQVSSQHYVLSAVTQAAGCVSVSWRAEMRR